MPCSVTGYSTALYATWWFIDDWGLLFDCGDGASSGLAQKGHKVSTIAISHADRDHLSGLIQFLQLNTRGSLPRILYPADCGSFLALAEFSKNFDPQRNGDPEWIPVREGDCIPIGKGRIIEVLPNDHIIAPPDQTKSVSYRVIEKRRHLREEHRNLSGPEIGALKQQAGEDAVTEERTRALLGFSGDAASPNPQIWQGVPTVIHEATFLDHAEAEGRAARHRHCMLPDVMAMAATLKLDCLVLGHFSIRYSHEEIAAAIETERHRTTFAGKVIAVLPGETSKFTCL